MKSGIKRSLCLAGCLSVLVLPTAQAMNIKYNVGNNDKNFSGIIKKGVLTGAADALSINDIASDDNFNVENDTNTGNINNAGTLTTNAYTVTAAQLTNTGSITGTGTLNISGGGTNSDTGSISEAIVNFTGSGSTFTNSSSISATTELTNSGTFNNNTGGSITTALLENTKTFNNNATLNATNITNSSSFTNASTASLIANKITNTAGTFSNKQAGSTVTEIDNKAGATYKNEAGNTVTTITNAGTFQNSASLTATGTVSNTKDFTNSSNLTAGVLNNTGESAQLTGEGNLAVSGGTNSGTITQNNVTVNGTYTNNKNLTSKGVFSNVGGAITGSGHLTVKNGTASATISQANMTIQANDLTNGFTNNTDITLTEALTVSTSAKFTNNASRNIVATSIVNNGTFTNNGTLGSISNKVAITNNGTMSIESGTLNVSSITNKSGKTLTNKVESTYDSITNEAGATYNNEANTTVTTLTNSGSFNNSAEVTVSTSFANNNANATFVGGTLNLTNGGSNAGTIGATGSSTTLNVNGGTFTNNNAVTNTTLTVANNASVTNSGNITSSNTTIDAGGSLTNSPNKTISGGTVTANGKLDNQGTINNGAVVTVKGSGTDASESSGTISGSTVNVTNGGSFTNSGNINNNSQVNVDAGTTFTNTATSDKSISGGTTITANGKFDNQGNVTGSTITINGSGVTNASTNSGTISNSNTTVSAGASLTNTGTITGNGTTPGKLDVSGTVNNQNTIGGAIALNIKNGGTLNVGTTETGKSASVNTEGKITIESDAKLNITQGGSATLKSGDDWSGEVENTNGTLNITSGTYTNNNYTQNGGSLNISGTNTKFELASGSSITNGIVNVTGGEFSLANGSSMTGGTVNVNSGTVGVSGTIADVVGLSITNGITYNIKDNGNVTINDNDTWSGTGKVQLSTATSTLTYNGAKDGTNGVLEAEKGNLNINSALTVGNNSKILADVKTAINNNVTINGTGNVTINGNDTWGSSATVNQSGGSLTITGYDKATQGQGTLISTDGNLAITNSTLDITGNSRIDNGSKVTISGSTLNVGGTGSNGGTVTLGNGDSWSGSTINLGADGTFNYNDITSTGTVNATGGTFNLNSGNLTLANGSNVADGATVNLAGNVNLGTTGTTGSSILSLNSDDNWTSGVVTINENGVFNYKDLTTTGTIVATDGTFNLESGNLTLKNDNNLTNAGIGAGVDANIAGNLTVNDKVSVALDDSSLDSWTGQINLNGGNLDYSLNSNGKLTSTKGNLNINGGTLTLDNASSVAKDVKTTINGNVVVKGSSTLNLNKTSETNTDTWENGVITVEQYGVLNYEDLTSTGTLVATSGTVNITSGNLTLDNTAKVADAGIAQAVKATISGDLTINENNTVVLNNDATGATQDSWTTGSTITLAGGSLDYGLTTNGILLADSGNLAINNGTLTLGEDSYVAGDVKTQVSSDVIAIAGGVLNLNKNEDGSLDSWSSNAKVTLNGGTLNYADLQTNGVFKGDSGNLNTEDGSVFNVTGTSADNPAYIGSDVVATIGGNLVIGEYGTVDLGSVQVVEKPDTDTLDTVLGNITVNEGGTLNIYNDLVFKTEESSQKITVNQTGTGDDAVFGVVNLNTTGNLELNADFAGAGPINKNGKGNVTFNGKFDDYAGVITINDGGDLAFKHGLMGNLVVGDVEKNAVIGILADIIDRDLTQEREITMKYSTYSNDKDLKLAMEDNSGITITRGSLIAESKADNNIIIGGYIDIDPAKEDRENPVSMTAKSNGSVSINNKVSVKEAELNVSAGVDNNLGKELNASDKAKVELSAGKNNNLTGDVIVANESNVKLTAGADNSFTQNLAVSGTSTVDITAGGENNIAGDLTITGQVIEDEVHRSTVNLSAGKSSNIIGQTTLTYADLKVLGDANFGVVKFNGVDATIQDMNGQINNNTIAELDLTDGMADFTVDINGRDWKHDKFEIKEFFGIDGGQINVSNWQFADDWTRTGKAPIDRHIVMNMFDVSNIPNEIAANINFTQTAKEIFTPIGWYKLENYTKWNKELRAYESVPGVLQASLARYNPQVFRGQVATLAMMNNQLLVDDMLTNHVGLQSERFLNPNANKYALSEGNYVGPYQYTTENGGLWMKNFASFEKLSMTQNLHVGNNFYGTLIGADLPVIDLRDGWKLVPTGYIGYNGAHQYYDNVSMYQNGGQLGFMGTFMKNDFIGSLLAYSGLYINDMRVSGYNEDALNYYVGTAAKAAYNLHPTKHFTVQPNVLVAYNFFGKQNWHSNYGDMHMASGVMNGINVAPGMNLIYARDTWSMYATFQYMYNINDDLTGKAGNVVLHNVQMKHGYFQYGFGMTKTWKDRMNTYFQLVFRNGGRTGIGFQLGANYKFDWNLPWAKKTKSEPKPKNQIKL